MSSKSPVMAAALRRPHAQRGAASMPAARGAPARAAVVLCRLALVLPVLWLAGCGGGVAGILYTLATETETGSNNLEDTLVVSNVVGTANTQFYVAAGSLWTRPDTNTTEWTKVTNTFPNGEAALFLSVVMATTDPADADFIYAGVFFPGAAAGARYGLFKADANGAGNSLTWTQISDPDVAAKQIYRVFLLDDGAITDRVMVVTVESSSSLQPFRYRLYFADDTTGDTYSEAATLPSPLSVPVTDAAHAAGTYWVVAGANVYSGAALTTLANSGGPEDDGFSEPPQGYAGIIATAADWLYLSDREGHLYWKPPAGSWGRHDPDAADADVDQVTVGGNVVQFTEFAQLGGQDIVVGTQGYGFYRFDPDAPLGENALTRGPDFFVTGLYEAAVVRFAAFGHTTTVFAATAGSGLFSSTWDTSSADFTTWTWE